MYRETGSGPSAAMTLSNTAERVAEVLRSGLENLEGRDPRRINEAVTRSVLIDRVLEELGYPATHRSPEDASLGNRPDDLCYLHPVRSYASYPALVVEAKKLGARFDQAPSNQPRGTSPDRQIQRYLRAPTIAGPNSIGVLTDGVRWRVYRRADGADAPDVQYSDYFDLTEVTSGRLAADGSEKLRSFVEQLSRSAVAAQTVSAAPPDSPNLADGLFEVVSDSQGPEQIVREILGDPDAIVNDRLENVDALTGVRRDAHDQDWERYTVSNGPNLSTVQQGLEGTPIVVGAVQFGHYPNRAISRGDVALCARTLAATSPGKAATVFAYEIDRDETITARMAVAVDDKVNMTAVFDPAPAFARCPLRHQRPTGGGARGKRPYHSRAAIGPLRCGPVASAVLW